jgi:glycosyltransferase involved in cell wall biosynthesis
LFTKTNLSTQIQNIPIDVIYPPVDISQFKEEKKTKTILSVGRFSSGYGAKKQKILIEAFQKFSLKVSGWELIFAGSMLPTDESYMQELKAQAKGLPISFYPNCSFHQLQKLYAQAEFYWHAAGFGETNPEHMEHFGITTVEAMASGCVPIAFAGGGQPEIIQDGINGRLWKTPEELIEYTTRLIDSKKEYVSMIHHAKEDVKQFSKQAFMERIDQLLLSVCGTLS